MSTANEIVRRALEVSGIYAADEDAPAADTQAMMRALNSMVRSYQARGAHLWTRKYATLFLFKGQNQYNIGGTAHCTESFTTAVTTATEGAGSTVISMDTTGMTVGDLVAVLLDDNTMVFSLLVSFTATEATITDGLASDAAEGNTVYFYTTKIGKALRIPDARRYVNGNEIPMIQMAKSDYDFLPNKLTQSQPVQFYYNPDIKTGELYLWPVPSDSRVYMPLTFYKPIDVFSSTASEQDFPDEWTETLEYNLAARAYSIFSQAPDSNVLSMAAYLYQESMNWDQGDESIIFQPSTY